MTDADRLERAFTDVVAVEQVAPGMAKVVTFGGAYTVDAREGRCTCPDEEYNEPAEGCKHRQAARFALGSDDVPHPALVTDDLSTRVVADGGREYPDGYKDAETLRRLYWEEEMSTTELAEKFGCSDTTIRNWMDKHDIERRDVEEATKMANRVEYAQFRTDQQGRERIECQTNGECVKLHRLLMVAEHGIEAVSNKAVHHKNGVPWDNRIENLEIMGLSEHNKHHHSNGDFPYPDPGEKHPNAKLSGLDIDKIKELREEGMNYGEIAEVMSISKSHTWRIVNGEVRCES